MQPHLVAVLQVLWNNGQAQALRPSQIADQSGGKGAYGNHSKLSYSPWNLVETVPGSKPRLRRLSERGIEFMKGNLAVPRDIVHDSATNLYVEKPGSDAVAIEDFEQN